MIGLLGGVAMVLDDRVVMWLGCTFSGVVMWTSHVGLSYLGMLVGERLIGLSVGAENLIPYFPFYRSIRKGSRHCLGSPYQ